MGSPRLSDASRSRRVLPLLSSAVTQWWRQKASESVDGCTRGASWKVSTGQGGTGKDRGGHIQQGLQWEVHPCAALSSC